MFLKNVKNIYLTKECFMSRQKLKKNQQSFLYFEEFLKAMDKGIIC